MPHRQSGYFSKRRDKAGSALAVLALAFGLLASSDASAQAPIAAQYVCDDGTSVAATFFPQRQSARLQIGGKTLNLPQRLSADGGRYAKGGVSFWVKGQQATLTRPNSKPTICRTR